MRRAPPQVWLLLVMIVVVLGLGAGLWLSSVGRPVDPEEPPLFGSAASRSFVEVMLRHRDGRVIRKVRSAQGTAAETLWWDALSLATLRRVLPASRPEYGLDPPLVAIDAVDPHGVHQRAQLGDRTPLGDGRWARASDGRVGVVAEGLVARFLEETGDTDQASGPHDAGVVMAPAPEQVLRARFWRPVARVGLELVQEGARFSVRGLAADGRPSDAAIAADYQLSRALLTRLLDRAGVATDASLAAWQITLADGRIFEVDADPDDPNPVIGSPRVLQLAERQLADHEPTDLVRLERLRQGRTETVVRVSDPAGPPGYLLEGQGTPIRIPASALSTLAEALAHLRVERWDAERAEPRHGLSPPRSRLLAVFDELGAEQRLGLELGAAATAGGCFARITGEDRVFHLSASRCAALTAPLPTP